MIGPATTSDSAGRQQRDQRGQHRPEDDQQQDDDEQDRQGLGEPAGLWRCAAWASTDWASSPAKWICRPGGAPARRTAARISSNAAVPELAREKPPRSSTSASLT